MFSESYSGLLNAMKKRRESKPLIFMDDTVLKDWKRDVLRLEEMHEKMFASLFGILIAVLALIISVVALFISKG